MDNRSGADRHDGAGRSARQLRRIAEALDLPLETFLEGGTVSVEVAQVGELLRMWSALDHEADRRRVLQMMRSMGEGRADA